MAADRVLRTQTTRAWGVLFVLCGALFLDALDVSMKGVALPAIRADLSMSTSALQWVISGYVLGFGGFLLLGGRTADQWGRRRVFLASLVVFALASGLGGAADNGVLLVAARFVTGMSAAFTAPAGLAIITTSYPEGAARNKALSIYTATGASGFSFGLVVGGLLTQVSWRWVFLLPVVIALLTLVGGWVVIPRTDGVPRREGFDVAGAVIATGAMLLLVFTLSQAPQVGWASLRTVGSLVGVVVLLTAFVLVERRAVSPLMRLGMLRSGPVIRANVGAMALVGGWVGCLFLITLYLQQVRDWSALETGLAVCPSGIVVAVLAPRIAAPLVGRFGTGPVIFAGLACAVLAYGLLLPLNLNSSYVPHMLPSFLLVGLAFALAYGPLNMAATSGIAAEEQGVAGGLVNASFQIGPALVLAVVTAVTQSQGHQSGGPASTIDYLRAGMVVPLLAALVGAGVTALGMRRRARATDEPGTALETGITEAAPR